MITKEFLQKQLTENILPFWLAQQDKDHGGFYGKVTIDLDCDPYAPKGGVMMSRFLWSFSHSYDLLQNKEYKTAADHAYSFLIDTLWDKENGGIYWFVDSSGETLNTIKHVYAQAFAIYGLSEYVKIVPTSEALRYAKKLYHLIEEKAYNSDTKGYEEEFDQTWHQKDLTQVATENPEVHYTTNTLLHLLEAYTNLYTVWKNDHLLERIKHLLTLFTQHIYHSQGYCLQEFNQNWGSISPGVSYGHDIETSWLIDETLEKCQITGELADHAHEMTASLAFNCFKNGLDDVGWMNNHSDGKHQDKTKVWWVQAEAVIGLFHAFQQSKNLHYREASLTLAHLIQQKFIDGRHGSEWYSRLDSEGNLLSVLRKNGTSEENISDAWKGPYHTVRFYLEMIRRLEEQ